MIGCAAVADSRPGDVVKVGGTLITVCAPDSTSTAPPTRATGPTPAAIAVTPAQRRLLSALCRPLHDSRHSAPASNRQIAEELVLSLDTVKGTLSALFERFGLAELPQNAKRATLAGLALDLLGDPYAVDHDPRPEARRRRTEADLKRRAGVRLRALAARRDQPHLSLAARDERVARARAAHVQRAHVAQGARPPRQRHP